MAKKVRKQKQKQKQSQNVNQKVIVKIGGDIRKKSRRRRTRKPKQSSSEGSSSMMQSLQPNVIYQSYKPEQTSTSSQNIPLSPAPTATNMVPETVKQPAARGAFEDVGVGTEGFVSILEKPTKKEQIQELITPVSKPLPVPSTGELPPWLREERPNPAFVEPSFYKSPEKPSSVFSVTPIKPSLDSPPWLASGFKTPFTPSPFYAEPTDISKTVDVEKELTQLADFIRNAAYPIGRPVEGPSITENLPVQQSQPENFSSSIKHMSDVTSNWDTKQMMKILDKKGQALERKQMGIEDVRSVKLGGSEYNFTPKPTFFQKLQKLPKITLPDIPETEVISPYKKKLEKKTRKVVVKNPVKKTLTEEQRLMRNAKARAAYASKKEQQQTVAIY